VDHSQTSLYHRAGKGIFSYLYWRPVAPLNTEPYMVFLTILQPGPVTGGFDAGCRHHFLLLLPSDHLQEPEDIHLINVGFFPAAVFRIRDILQQIRGSVPLTSGSGSFLQ